MLAKIPKLTSIFPTAMVSKSKLDEVEISTDRCDGVPDAMGCHYYTPSQAMDVQPAVTEAEAEGMVDTLETTVPAASNVPVYDTDLAKWPEEITKDMREYWAQCGSKDCQHPDVNFEASKIADGNRQVRYFSKCLFTYIHPLTERSISRTWLCYSPSTGYVFCFHCKLFSHECISFTRGYNDWKNASRRIQEHERSDLYVSSITKLNDFGREKARVDEKLMQQYNAECSYWRAVLERVVEVIKFLAERGLPFRGQDEIVGSKSNGNYLGVLELISKFDPFLAAHMEKQKLQHANGKGRGSTTYLSSTVCGEFITIMGKQVMDYIINELKAAKFFSVSIDSPPDASNVDRLTCIFRYVPDNSPIPVERIMKFIGMEGHSTATRQQFVCVSGGLWD